MFTLHDYALASEAEAQAILGISGNEDKLRFLINASTDFIEKACNRRFKSTSYTGATAELRSGDGNKSIFLKNYPVTALTQLELNETFGNESNWNVIDAADYFFDEESGIVDFVYSTTKGHNNYRVAYTGGYTTIPSDLKMACIWLVGEAFKRSGSIGIKSESLGDHSLVFDASLMSDGGNPVTKTINRYRRMVLPGYE